LSEVVKAPVERPDGERPGIAGELARRRLDDDWRVEEVGALWPRGLYNHPAGGGEERHLDSRGHFFAAAAEARRRTPVESARREKRGKHGRTEFIPFISPTPDTRPRDKVIAAGPDGMTDLRGEPNGMNSVLREEGNYAR
jgi:hypothetical protein